jgi:hypothetical protein
MKLFKSLLVAPAALGLLAPISATASEVNLNDIANYSDVESIDFVDSFSNVDSNNPLLAGGEGLVESPSYDGSFSETTTASFSVEGYLGSTDDDDGAVDDAVAAGYGFQIDLNTSFTGEDSLDISIDAGTGGTEGIAEFDGNGNGDGLDVDGISYTFPVGDKTTVIVGADTDGSALFTTACVYGGPGNMLDDCANVNAGITGGTTTVGASYDFGSGFTAAVGAQTDNTSVFTEESGDAWALNAAYTADKYAISLTYGVVEAVDANDALTDEEDKFTAINAYYTPDAEGFPSISVGYEFGDIGGAAAGADEQASFMVGLTWDEVGPGSAGVAVGHSNTNENADELYQYEAYYEYPVNDSMTITPLIYTLDAAGDVDDTTGMMVKTSFSF